MRKLLVGIIASAFLFTGTVQKAEAQVRRLPPGAGIVIGVGISLAFYGVLYEVYHMPAQFRNLGGSCPYPSDPNGKYDFAGPGLNNQGKFIQFVPSTPGSCNDAQNDQAIASGLTNGINAGHVAPDSYQYNWSNGGLCFGAFSSLITAATNCNGCPGTTCNICQESPPNGCFNYP